MLTHEKSLSGFAAEIGGSAGRGTHGRQRVDRPAAMPSKQEATHIVSNKRELLDAVTTDKAVVYIDDDIDVTGVEDQWIGDDITLVGGFCDPNIPGRGPVVHSDEPSKYVFKSAYGKAPTLWGVSFEGPETAYQDPDHTAADFSETFASALFCYDEDTLRVYGCEFFGWTLAGLLVGSKEYETRADIDRSSFHHNQMEHLGYGIEHFNGFLSVDRCFFDKCRHAISSFGYPTGGYAVANSVFGPGPWCGHVLDMHCLANNLSTDDRTAGKFVRVYHCTSMINGTDRDDVAGRPQEFVTIRGEPVEQSYTDKCHLHHTGAPKPTGDQGSAWRQESEWHDPSDEWLNFEPRDNAFGPEQSAKTLKQYGAPRAKQPPQPPQQPMQTLTIHGHGVNATYRIRIDGDATMTGEESSESITEHDDGTVTISGYVVGYSDTFEISNDATPIAASITGPLTVMRNGTKVDIGMLASIDDGDDETTDVSDLRERVRRIESTLAAIKKAFST